MKKTLISLLIMAAPVAMFAQFEVNSTGNVKVGTTVENDDTDYTMVSVSNHPTYVWPDYYSHKMGIQSILKPVSTKDNVAIHGEVYSSTTVPKMCTGVWGLAGGSSHGANYGVAGCLYGNSGAGIYGTTSSEPDDYFSGHYAGYFDGDTYVNGYLTTWGLTSLEDLRLKKDVVLLGESSEQKGTTLQNLQNLSVMEYSLAKPQRETNKVRKSDTEDNQTAEKDGEEGRRHFGVSAEELQKIYPNLVRKGQDGYLTVNYIELVPVLIRSIQELSQKVTELEGAAVSDVPMSRAAATTFQTAQANTSANVLYQNTPNPFKEKTTIRFSLADDAQNAAVCIFDLSGKMLKKLPISSGETSVSVNGYDLGEGMFLYTLMVNGQEVDTKRMIITK